MKHIFKTIFSLAAGLFITSMAGAQVTTNSGAGLAASYADLASAITALNAASPITSPVVITLTGNETAPVGGYSITAIGSAANTITIQGVGSTITANGALVAGTLSDGIFKLIGADYVTLQNFTMQENAANTITAAGTNNMTEWGVALLYKNNIDGAQNNTIQNNIISLNRNYLNSFGIYSNVRHSATAPTTTADILATSGSNSNNKIYGNTISNINMGVAFIGSGTAAFQDTGNDVGGASLASGNIINNWGGAAAASSFPSNTGTSYCIFMNHQTAFNVSYNTLTSASVSGTAVTFRGIVQDYTTTSPTGTFTNNITNNTITMSSGFTSGTFTHIATVSGNNTMTLNVTNNTILNSVMSGAASSSTINGITNTGSINTLNISGNIIRGLTSTATSGGFTGISNSGSVTATINITNNQLGNASGNLITFSAATSGALIGIGNSGGSSTAILNITGNDVRGIVYSVAATASNTYYSNGSHSGSSNISNNTFTNLTINSTGSVTFISNNVTHAANTTHNVNNNSVVTGFSKTGAGGTILFYNSFSTSGTTVTEINTGNNFSNLTFTGATTITGWRSDDGSTTAPYGPRKTITNNTFNNITNGSGTTQILQVGSCDNTFANNNVSGNIISNILSAGSINAITTDVGNQNFFSNTIFGLSSTGANAVVGINISTGTTQNIYKNKIYDITGNNAGASVNGVLVSAGTTVTISNNIIGDLKAPATTSATDAIRGINITSTTATSNINVYFNTINLNASSSGANFSTSCIFHTTSATATTAALDLRNNILVNTSAPSGTGNTVAYRRSSTTLTNYANTSNRNDFVAPVIFADGTNSDVTLAAYQARVAVLPADAASLSVAPSFLSTTGSMATFLHIDPSITTALESGAGVIAGQTTDFDGDIRNVSTPDIGADEFAGTSPAVALNSVTASPAGNNCVATARTITANTTAGAANIASVTLNYSYNGAAPTSIPMTGGTLTGTSDWTGIIPAATPTTATVTWNVVATDGTYTKTLTGTSYTDDPLNGATLTASATLTSVCAGSPTSVSAEAVKPGTVVAGAGASTSSSSGVSPYYHGYGGQKAQYIFKASELTALGLRAGNITSLSFEITTLGTATFNNFAISIGHTSQTAATANAPIVTGLTQVYANAAQALTSGVNNYSFSTPFTWDGTSNIVVSVCYSNNNTGGTSSTVKTDAAGFVSTMAVFADNASASAVCGATSDINIGVTTYSNSTSSNRPKISFGASKVLFTPATISWSDGSATVGTTNPLTVSPTGNTTYTPTATDANGCSISATGVAITVIPVSVALTPVNVTCNGGNDGSFTLGVVTCGTGPFTYSLDGGTTFGTIPTNLTAGTYPVIVKDAGGFMSASQNVVITQPSWTVPVATSAGNKTICQNGPGKFVRVTPGAVSNAQTVTVNFNVAGQPVETNSAPGNLVASAILPAIAGTVTNVTLTYNGLTALGGSWRSDIMLGLSGSVVNAAAVGTGAPGSAGTFNYTRVIPNNAVNTAGGTVNLLYWDDLSDNGGAEATFPTGPTAATLTITYNPVSTISWYDASTAGNLLGAGDSLQAVGTSVLANTTTPGTYNFYAQANYNGCTAASRTLVTVTVNALPTVSYTATPNDTVCAGTQITLAGTGAISYSWNNGITNNTAATLTTQTYTVTGTDANGCVNTANAPVKVNALPNVSASVSPNDSVCAGTQVTLNGGGAASYTWDNSVINNTAFTPSTGTYTVTGTDVNGCTKTASIALVVSTGLTASATNTSISCNGGNSTVTVSATGGVSPYTGTGTFSVTAGTYSYTVTDAVGCISVASVTIGEPSALSVSSSVTAPIACNGDTGAVTVVATGGTSPYTGTGVQTVYSGAYTFTVTDASGCSATTTGNVSEPAALVASYTSTAISCNGGNSSVTVSATGGTSPYTGIGTAAIAAGTYNDYIVTDDNGCTDTIDIVIAEPAAVVVSITSTPIACNGGSSTIVVSATGGTGSYTGDGTFTETAGTYNYTVTDANSCTGTASVTISEPTAFTVSTSTTAILCNGGTSTITVTGNGGTSPYTGEVTETQPDGTYNYSLTDANGCTASTSVTVTEPTALSATSSVTTPIACNGGNGTVTVVATGGTSPYTGDGAQTVSAGTYNLTVTDANGCSTSTTGTISEPTPLVASATTTAILCNGGTSTVVVSATGGTAPYSGEGSFIANAGSYSYTITDDNGCTSDATGTISEPAVLNADITTSTIICYGDSATVIVTASGGTSPYTGEVTEMQATGTYNYTVSDDNGCSASNSVTITEPAENIVNQSVTICPGGMVMVGSSMYMTAGTYADTLTGNAGCDSIVNTTVIVNSAVTTTVTVNNETITSDEVGATYQWIDCNNNNAIISGETNQAFTATTNGSYAVIVTANGCASDTSDCTTILTVGIKATSQNLFSVYPNPNNGEFTISTNVAGTYNIVNELGQSIQTLNLNNSNDLKVTLNLSNGVYYVVGYNESNIVKQKIVVLK